MSYQYKVTEDFWKNFYQLPQSQMLSVREKWKIFKVDPFHPSLGTHKIQRLSAAYRHTVYSVVIEADLRVLFRIDGNVITTLDVGTHSLYHLGDFSLSHAPTSAQRNQKNRMPSSPSASRLLAIVGVIAFPFQVSLIAG